jgi:alpha-glucuronidase
LSAISGVANIGSDANWTGSHFNQANWYVYGRMAWDPDLPAKAVAEEWVKQTFSNDPLLVTPVVALMMSSRQTLVNYMEPLGLAHMMGTDHHYGPAPWVSNLSQPEWNPVYYHKADSTGLGFDRTATGSNAVSQYASAVGRVFADRATISDDSLLFFQHVGWGETLDTGKTLWEELVRRYSQGVDDVGQMRQAWATVKTRVDGQRFAEVTDFLQIQHYEARWWRDACLSYFATFSKLAIPKGYAAPANALSFYQGLSCPADVKKPRCPQVYTGNPSPAVLP